MKKTFYSCFSEDSKNVNFSIYLKEISPELMATDIAFCWGLDDHGRLGGGKSLDSNKKSKENII